MVSRLHKYGDYQRQKSSVRTQEKYCWPGNINNSVVEVWKHQEGTGERQGDKNRLRKFPRMKIKQCTGASFVQCQQSRMSLGHYRFL